MDPLAEKTCDRFWDCGRRIPARWENLRSKILRCFSGSEEGWRVGFCDTNLRYCDGVLFDGRPCGPDRSLSRLQFAAAAAHHVALRQVDLR